MKGRLRLFLALVIIATFCVVAYFFPDPYQKLFALTGEESLLKQIYGLSQWALNWTRLLPRTKDDVAVAYADLPPFGVNTHLEQEVEIAKRERTLQMIRDAGFQWVRQSFPWYDIEVHAKGDFEDRRNEPYRSSWDKYDNIVDLVEQFDLDLIVRLEHPPAWSRHDGEARGSFGPPDNIEDYADYISTLVSRYQGRIRFYQIWNEPNIYPEWGNQPVDPAAYTELLCLAYQRIKAADPQAVVVSGALAPTAELGTWNTTYNGNNLMDVIFLQRMYDAGAQDCFDIMAVNDYMLYSGPSDRRMRPTQDEINFSRPLWVRDVMVANGDAHKPVWISEMNSNAVPEDIEARYGRVTLEQQARYAPLAYERIQREWPWAGVTTMWYFKRAYEKPEERAQADYYFRLLDVDFNPLPVYESLSEYINTLTPTLYAGHHQENAWQLSYGGTWTDQNSAAAELGVLRQTSDLEATLSLTWEGKKLTLIPGPGAATLRVVDAENNAREFALDGKPVVLASYLRQAPREVMLTVLDGDFSVDAFVVK